MITALHDTNGVDDLDRWADQFGITHPVGLDDDQAVLGLYTERPGRPQYAVVSRSFDVVAIGLNRQDAFDRVLEELGTD